MKFLLMCSIAVLIPFAAMAQEGERSLLCNRKVAHTPISDVQYQSGVDVDGNAVAPADVPNNNNVIVTEVVQIPLTVDLAQWLSLPVPTGTKMETVLGFLEVGKDGSVSYNGQSLDDQLDKLCAFGKAPVQQPQNPPPPAVAK